MPDKREVPIGEAMRGSAGHEKQAKCCSCEAWEGLCEEELPGLAQEIVEKQLGIVKPE